MSILTHGFSTQPVPSLERQAEISAHNRVQILNFSRPMSKRRHRRCIGKIKALGPLDQRTRELFAPYDVLAARIMRAEYLEWIPFPFNKSSQ